MKNLNLLLAFLFLIPFNSFSQDSANTDRYQIGVTTLPIIYLNNGSGGNEKGIHGFAAYGNFGWMLNQKNVFGLRPFIGLVDHQLENNQRMVSTGLNAYYRVYIQRKRLSIFLDANLGLGYIWYSSKNSGPRGPLSSFNGTMFNYAFGPGIDFEISNGLNVEFLVQHLRMANISHPEDTNDGSTIIPSVGIQKFF